MGFLLAAVPWYYRAAAGLVLIVGAFAFGAMQGVQYEADRRDAADAKRTDEAQRIVTRETTKIEVRYVERAAKRSAERAAVTQEVIAHATAIPDPPSGWLAPDRVRNINRAWFGPDPGVEAGKLPAPDPTPIGKPQ